jgi:transcriptional antiterminator RfaH
MDDVTGKRIWRLAQLKPNAIQIAERNLRRQGFEIFSPRQSETLRRGARFVTVEKPLFPGYLFVATVDGGAPWRTINNTYGVSKLVAFSEHAPAAVPLEVVAGLQARCDSNGLFGAPEALSPGDQVKIVSGPFAEFIGKVETLTPQKRVWVLLDLLGGVTRVGLDDRQVHRV